MRELRRHVPQGGGADDVRALERRVATPRSPTKKRRSSGHIAGGRVTRSAPDRAVLGRSRIVKLSARNVLKGTVTEIEVGTVNAVVKLDIGAGQMISSMITLDALKDLDVTVGNEVYAIIKSSSIILGTM